MPLTFTWPKPSPNGTRQGRSAIRGSLGLTLGLFASACPCFWSIPVSAMTNFRASPPVLRESLWVTLLSSTEFWAALFGALSAFLLGPLQLAHCYQWEANRREYRHRNAQPNVFSYDGIERSVVYRPGSATYGIARATAAHIRISRAGGSAKVLPRVQMDSLGFLADCHNPNVLNRLFAVQSGFDTSIQLIGRHELLHVELQRRLAREEQRRPNDISGTTCPTWFHRT